MASGSVGKMQNQRGWRTSLRWLAIPLVVVTAMVGTAVEFRALQSERDQLVLSLRAEHGALLRQKKLTRQLEAQYAAYRLDTQVRRDFVDSRMGQQERRAAALEIEADAVKKQKLAEADCLTPKSILSAVGL